MRTCCASIDPRRRHTHFGRRVRPYSRRRAGALGSCVVVAALNLSRHRPRSSPHCARRAHSRTLTAFWPRVLRSPRADRRAGSLARRAAGSTIARASGTAAHARRPGPVLSSVPTAAGRSRQRPRPAREALSPARVHGHSGVPGITSERATVEWTVESNLDAQLQGSCALGRDMGFQPGPHANIS